LLKAEGENAWLIGHIEQAATVDHCFGVFW
jgi:hypothetical protein